MEVKHVDLFAGIGGFSIAAERVGWQTVAFCETDEFCRGVLQRRFDCDRWISLPGLERSGEGLGLRGDTELAGLDADWLVIENVGHTWRRWVPELRRRLHERGYASLPLRVQASDLGFPHRRSRVFVVANADSEQLRELSRWWERSSGEVAAELAVDGADWLMADARGVRLQGQRDGRDVGESANDDARGPTAGAGSQARRKGAAQSRVRRVTDGVPDRAHRIRALGNAIVPAAAELVFRGIRHVLGAGNNHD